MPPLESDIQLTEEEWNKISKENPPRGRGRTSLQTNREKLLVELAQNGSASRLVYSNPTEAYKKQMQLRLRGGNKIRIIGDPDNPNALIIGPVKK